MVRRGLAGNLASLDFLELPEPELAGSLGTVVFHPLAVTVDFQVRAGILDSVDYLDIRVSLEQVAIRVSVVPLGVLEERGQVDLVDSLAEVDTAVFAAFRVTPDSVGYPATLDSAGLGLAGLVGTQDSVPFQDIQGLVQYPVTQASVDFQGTLDSVGRADTVGLAVVQQPTQAIPDIQVRVDTQVFAAYPVIQVFVDSVGIADSVVYQGIQDSAQH